MTSSQARASFRGSRIQIGEWLKEKWHIDALLGSGGVGTVYAVTHRNQSRAAIKVLHADLASDPDIIARFLLEGYVANAVGHPGVVQILDDDATSDGVVFLVMELLDGETLDQHARSHGGTLSAPEVLAIADMVLAVLEAAHAKNIVHRDLKTENVFLCKDGTIKVLDFGLARIRDAASPSRAGTQLGAMMGTPGFMPPEQVRGRWDHVDARSDLWAVGATIYALLTGKRVHEGEGHEVDVFASATKPVPSLAEVLPDAEPGVVELVDRALAQSPGDRWPTASAMRAALAEALPGGTPSRAHSLQARSTATEISEAAEASPPSSGSGEPRSLRPPNNVDSIAIAPGTYWVGMRDPRPTLCSNPYLRIFDSAGAAPYHLLIDPGSSADFAVVTAKVGSLIGRIGSVSGMFVSDPDPGSSASVAAISTRYAARASILCSEATWQSIVCFGLSRDRFVDTGAAPHGIDLAAGHRVIPVPAPYCPGRGAVMLYDPATRVLFSGALFSGFTAATPHDLWAEPGDFDGVRAFHQAYMPSNRAILAAVRAIRRLDPPVEIIAPRRGRLLRGAVLQLFLAQLEHLPVGLDLMNEDLELPSLDVWLEGEHPPSSRK